MHPLLSSPSCRPHAAGMGTWTAAGGLALAGCVLGCCLLPFAWDTCKDATHTCPECGCELGKRVSREPELGILGGPLGMQVPRVTNAILAGGRRDYSVQLWHCGSVVPGSPWCGADPCLPTGIRG